MGGYNDGKEDKRVFYSKDGKRILSYCQQANGESLTVWDGDTGRPVFHLDGKDDHTGVVRVYRCTARMVRQSPAGSEDKMIRLWDIDTGKERCAFDSQVVSIDHHAACVNRLAILLADGKALASGSYDKTEQSVFGALATGRASWPPSRGDKYSLVLGRRVFSLTVQDVGLWAARTTTIRLWDVETGKEKADDPRLLRDTSFKCGPWHPARTANSAVAGFRTPAVADKGEEGAVTLFDIATGKALQVLTRTQQYPFCSVSFSPDGKTLGLWAAYPPYDQTAGS